MSPSPRAAQSKPESPRSCAARRARAGATLVVAALCAGAALVPDRAAAAERERSIAGLWATAGFGSIVALAPCSGAPAALCGRIVWLWQPDDAEGRPRVDGNNPDRAARARPLLGSQILWGLRETAPGVWSEGHVYNPDDGRTYTGALRVRGDALELRGCALRVFCETQVWRRPDDLVAALRRLER